VKKDATRESLSTTTWVDLMCGGVHKGSMSALSANERFSKIHLMRVNAGVAEVNAAIAPAVPKAARFVAARLGITGTPGPIASNALVAVNVLKVRNGFEWLEFAHHSLPHIHRIAKSGEQVTHEANDCSGCADCKEGDTAGSKAKGGGVEGVFVDHSRPRLLGLGGKLGSLLRCAPVFMQVAQLEATWQQLFKLEDVCRGGPTSGGPSLDFLISWFPPHLPRQGSWPAVVLDQADDCGRVVRIHAGNRTTTKTCCATNLCDDTSKGCCHSSTP
jgi:hypothetical protein